MAIKHYRLEEVCHSKETKPQKKTFVNLDGHTLGLDIDWDANQFRFTIFKGKKKNVKLEGNFMSFDTEKDDIKENLVDIVSKWYTSHGRNSELPMYTRMELAIPASHLHYHLEAGTLARILEKEVIYN